MSAEQQNREATSSQRETGSANEIARRTQVCSAVEAHIMGSVSRHAGPALDEVDERMYQAAIKPLLSAIWRGAIQADAPDVWKLIFAVRGAERRPRPEQVEALVRKALGLAEPSAPIDARNVVRAPLPPERQLPSKDGPPGAWMAHLPPSGDAERDAFLVDILVRTEAAMGASMAVGCAQRVVAVRQALEAEREEQRRQRLQAIPEDDRDDYLRRAGGDVVKAVQLYVAKQRQRMGQDALSQWRRGWGQS